MATKSSKKSRTESSIASGGENMELSKALGAKYEAAKNAMVIHYPRFDDAESMILMQNREKMAKDYRSSVNDGRLSTMVWERCARVMAKPLKGQVRALTKKNKGIGAAMDMALTRYVIPKSNEQMDHLTKLRMWGHNAAGYGSQPMLRFWKISPNYIGPDCYLIPIRNYFPQPGKVATGSMDWTMVRSTLTVGQLKEYAKDKTGAWDTEALKRVIAKAEKAGTSGPKDAQHQSQVEQRDQGGFTGGEKGDFAEVDAITCYEAGDEGHWITFCPQFKDEIIRDIENPHGDAKIPIIMRDCFPLLDSIIGLGDFERGKTLQFALNSLVNLYLDSMKMQLYSPIAVDQSQVYPNSFRIAPGAIWKTKTIPSQAIQPLNFSPQGLNTFQSTYQMLSAALQNMSGTTTVDVSSGDSGDPTFGKTEKGIEQTMARESARDDWDRFMQEIAVGELYEDFVNMLAKNNHGRDAIFHIFDDDVEQLKKTGGFENADKIFDVYDDGKTAKVRIPTKDLQKTDFRFLYVPGSTRKEDQRTAYENITNILIAFGNMGDRAAEAGLKVNWSELLQQLVSNSGIDNVDKILLTDKEAQKAKAEAAAQAAEKEMNFSNVNYKDLPEDVKRMAEGREYGAPSQEMSPEQEKIALAKAKQILAERKQDLAEQKAAADMAHKQAEAEDKVVDRQEQIETQRQAAQAPAAGNTPAAQPAEEPQPSGRTVTIEVPEELLAHPSIANAEQLLAGIHDPGTPGGLPIDEDVSQLTSRYLGGSR